MASRALLKAIDAGDYVAARRVAAHWHGGRDTNITGLSHGTDWGTAGLIRELTRLLEGNLAVPPEQLSEEILDGRSELEALLNWANGTWKIDEVESFYGHYLTSDGDHDTCIICKAQYELVHTGPNKAYGRYRNSWGRSPVPCTGRSHDENSQCNCLVHS
jgi:hypothetical protein